MNKWVNEWGMRVADSTIFMHDLIWWYYGCVFGWSDGYVVNKNLIYLTFIFGW